MCDAHSAVSCVATASMDLDKTAISRVAAERLHEDLKE